MGRAGWRRRKTALLIAVALLGAGLGVLAYATHLLRRSELQTIDARFSLRGSKPAPSDIVVVQIDNGTLVEFLRTYPGSRVNQHVARFVFWGKQTEHLMSSQPWNYALGSDSALERFLKLDGKIVLLGFDHDAVTFLHYVEHVADIPAKRIARYQVPLMENQCQVWRAMEEFDTSGDGVHANWPDRFFAKIVDSLLIKTRNNGARVGNAMTYILSARELLDFALPLMKAVAADPLVAESLKELSAHS